LGGIIQGLEGMVWQKKGLMVRFGPQKTLRPICINAQYSTFLHFKPPKPYLKNISKIYLWINLWITNTFSYQTNSNWTSWHVDNHLISCIYEYKTNDQSRN
jgi:hypothetical protein